MASFDARDGPCRRRKRGDDVELVDNRQRGKAARSDGVGALQELQRAKAWMVAGGQPAARGAEAKPTRELWKLYLTASASGKSERKRRPR